ncbi:hypothetical protein [Dokdonella soli]|uniref:Nuclear transport factor 2 family protein n=1 Tax=Dokdonella soli TaxID=529810 RepID=A0ABN1IBX6_9GAMM
MRWWTTLACSIFVAACARQSDADAVRAAIMEISRATEAHQSADVLARVSDDFAGNTGEVDRAQLANLLRMQLLANRSIGVRLGGIDVDMSGERATARFDVTLTDASGRWFAERSTTLHFVTGWRRERGAWRCYNASWEQKP